MKTDTDSCGAGTGFRHFTMTDKIGGTSVMEETARTEMRQAMQAKIVKGPPTITRLHGPDSCSEVWLYGQQAANTRQNKFRDVT